MSGIAEKSRPAFDLEQWFERIDSHVRRAKALGGILEDAYGDLLLLVRLETSNAREAGERIHALLDVIRVEIGNADNLLVHQLEIITDFVPQTSVGKHTDLRQRTDWAEAVNAYSAADAASVDTDNPDSVVDAAADAFKRLVGTRPPNLRCLHEKLTLIQTAGGWHTDGVIGAVFNDVEALARKHEILGSAAQAEG